MKKIKIEAILEISDHDGYCTDNECTYSKKTTTHYIDAPLIFKHYPIGPIINSKYDWVTFLPTPDINMSGSYYCKEDYSVKKAGLNCHDYKYTITSIEIVEINEL